MSSEDDRKFAAMAIEQAAQSKDENQSKAHPRVGAVVVKNGQVLGVAHRGQKEPGEHAEYTVLERVLGSVDVSSATVYTTLEPCTYRNPPKIPLRRAPTRSAGQPCRHRHARPEPANSRSRGMALAQAQHRRRSVRPGSGPVVDGHESGIHPGSGGSGVEDHVSRGGLHDIR